MKLSIINMAKALQNTYINCGMRYTTNFNIKTACNYIKSYTEDLYFTSRRECLINFMNGKVNDSF